MKQKPFEFKVDLAFSYRLPFLLSLPVDYKSQEKWPLILFLHGAGERGRDFDLLRKHGIPKVVEERELPFITLSPQCPKNSWWSEQIPCLDALLKLIVKEYAVDKKRIYVTGLSMGGFGTWHLAVTYPRRFAAIAPICGGGVWYAGFPERVRKIKHLPVWVFHGAKDRVVSPGQSKILVKELEKNAGKVRFTLYPNAAHDAWTETYNNRELYEWFLANKREKNK